jgi:isopenicillin-N N-acyltransferase-like protein
MTTQFPTVRVSGPPRERGRQYGEAARERVRISIDAYRDVFAHYAGWDWEKVTDEALRYMEPVRAFDERYLQEMQGLAEGADVAFDDVLAINARTEIMFAAKARAAEAQARTPAECTSFAVLPEASESGHTLIGQNWDWLLHSFDTCVVLEVRQDDGPDFVTVVEAGLLAKTGMNSSGIGLCANALVSDADRGAPGVPFHLLLRGILDAENLSDALAALQRGFRSSSANYLVAHRDAIAVDVEAATGDFARLFLLFPNGGVLTHTNHFLSPSFDGKDVSLWVMPDSPFRLERIRSHISAAGGALSVETFQSALADHANYPSGVCCHPDARDAVPDQGATVASILMDLDERRMWLSEGQPCSHPYRVLEYGDFLSKPSRIGAAEGHPAHRVPA